MTAQDVQKRRTIGYATAFSAGNAGSSGGAGAPSFSTCEWQPAIALRVSTISRAERSTMS